MVALEVNPEREKKSSSSGLTCHTYKVRLQLSSGMAAKRDQLGGA
jgi:hypothetical protein